MRGGSSILFEVGIDPWHVLLCDVVIQAIKMVGDVDVDYSHTPVGAIPPPGFVQ